MSSTDANGHAPVDLAHVDTHAARAAERLAAQTASLRELLADEDAVQERLRIALDDSKQRQHGLRRAIDALDPPVKEPKVEPPRRGRPPKTRTGDGATGYLRPTDKAVDRTMRELVGAGRPMTVDQLLEEQIGGNGHGISRDTLRRAIYALRDDGRVRLAGRTDRGGQLFAAMPEELDGGVDGTIDDGNALWNAGAKAAS